MRRIVVEITVKIDLELYRLDGIVFLEFCSSFTVADTRVTTPRNLMSRREAPACPHMT